MLEAVEQNHVVELRGRDLSINRTDTAREHQRTVTRVSRAGIGRQEYSRYESVGDGRELEIVGSLYN